MREESPGVARPLLPAYVHSTGFAQVVSCLRHPVNGLYFSAPKRARIGWYHTAGRLLSAFLLLAGPALAQEPAPPEPDYLPIAPAAWCLVLDTEPETPEADEDPGCDAGIAASLYRFRREPRASIVGALGTWSLGPGVGWTFHRSASGTAYAVAGGVVVPWDGQGIRVREWGIAIGATVSFARAGRSGNP